MEQFEIKVGGLTIKGGADDSAGYPAQARRAEIERRLSQIDADAIRPVREIAQALAAGVKPAAFPVSKLAALETEAQGLRAELKAL